jgi:hypothetical protein
MPALVRNRGHRLAAYRQCSADSRVGRGMANQSRVFTLGEVLAERQMQFVANAGWTKDVVVRIGRPVRDPESARAWVCPYQIEGLGYDDVKGIFGADAMQALLLGIHTIPGELAPYTRDPGGKFMRHGQPDSSFLVGCRTTVELAGDAFPELPD